jgi:cytochrome c oxidase assembly factor 7
MAFDLKKEEDVKEYLDKLGIEYRFGCYSEKKPDGENFINLTQFFTLITIVFLHFISVCHLLGDFLESIKKDYEKAGKVFRANCDDYGYAKSCLKFGHYSFLGKGKASKSGDKGDPAQAYNYYQKGCEMKDPDCCLHSGLLMISRQKQANIERDVVKGMEQLTKSCTMNNGTACFYLSGMYISGVYKDELTGKKVQNPQPNDFLVQKDMKKAFEFASKACDLDNMYACANLSQMYMKGDGTEKNEKKAEVFKKKALEMQEQIKKQQAELKFQQGISNV